MVNEAVDFIVPLILDKGMVSASPEIRGFSLSLLVKLIQVQNTNMWTNYALHNIICRPSGRCSPVAVSWDSTILASCMCW